MKRFLLFFYCAGSFSAIGQASSVLSSGKWYKLSVQFDAIYRIDYNTLKKIGINPDGIDPKKIRLYAGTNSMLPQANSTPRIKDLQEVALYAPGEADGKFNSQDYILFYGQGPDGYQLLPDKKIFSYQNNLYTDKNCYFLTVSTVAGARMTVTPDQAGSFPIVDEFDDFSYYETEQYNDLHSGRDWFGEQFDSKTENTIRFQLPDIIDGSTIKLVSNVMGQSFAESTFQVSYNGTLVAEQKPLPLFNFQYSSKGSEVSDTLSILSTSVKASSQPNQDIKLKFIKATSGRSVGYLDYLLLQAKRKLALYGDQTIFHSLKSIDQPVSRFSISNMSADALIWDVSDAFNAGVQQVLFESGSTSFAAASTSLRKYIASSNKNFPVPTIEGEVPNQNLHGIANVGLLIVTAPEFLPDAKRLATYRQSKNSLAVTVVTTTQVYNEFSGGKQDVTAIRDLVKYLYDQKTGIRNLLLFGRGSYDYKNYLPYNKNFVPTYESMNSLNPLETYSSDDYFGFLEANEGRWLENPAESHTLDIGVGRLPIKKAAEAKIVVDKIIEYENQNWGDWRKQLLFVADDGDFNIHQGQSEQLAETIEADHPEFNTEKIFLDAFKQSNSPIGQVSPDATTALTNRINKGVAIVNYTGHGSEQQWMQERIVDQVSIEEWKSSPRYPLLVTATCEFGRNDDPGLIATSETSLLREGGGSIGLVTTTRPVNSATNFTLNKAFYQALFTKESNRFRDLGAVFRDTKNNSISGVSNRNFSLLGDPSMILALPSSELKITSIKNLTSGSDTLKALSKIKLKGTVYTDGLPDFSYTGTLNAAVFDKPAAAKTKGDENPPFDFKIHDNAVFRGQASIQNGNFEMEFILPEATNPLVGVGKLSLYASPAGNGRDVAGANTILKLGAIEKDPGSDAKPPTISLYIGDSTFTNGGVAGTNSRIAAILSDESGINISDFVPQKAITAVLDDSITFILNKYYVADVDNAQRGKVFYPLNNMKSGQHHLTLSAFDTFGNGASASVAFSVSDQNGIQIEQWLNYPNPVTSTTTFHFKHNRSGDDLEAVVTLYNLMGQPVISTTYQIMGSAYQVDLPEWDGTAAGGTKLSPGLYLSKLMVRSLLDGSENEKITKVIISN